jgi:nucleoside-diphosphate-sugar epimerase
MQTILGANGIIATELAKSLHQMNLPVRLVSRNPKIVKSGDDLYKADLLNYEECKAAVKGSDLVYLTAGLSYNTKIWQNDWPKLIENVVKACQFHQVKLVFFDNVYLYGKVSGEMTEQTPTNPCSKKGEVRAKVVEFLEREMGNAQLIGRSADFIGHTEMSFLTEMVFKRLAAGKSAQWMLNPETLHTYTYVKDAGKALAILGNTPEAFGQAWHLPADSKYITGRELVEIAAINLHAKNKISSIPKWMLSALGLFVPVLKENMEMLYQMESPYYFSSAKFDNKFGKMATPIRQAIKETALSYAQ